MAFRFRLSDENTLVRLSTGPFPPNEIAGEVEDLWVNITGLDWGDLPEPLYATNANGRFEGPSHQIRAVLDGGALSPSLYIIGPPDADPDGNPSEMADGDNNEGVDDEQMSADQFTNPLTGDSLLAGNTIQALVPIENNTSELANVYLFIDWNEDGIFDTENEAYTQEVLTGAAVFDINIPATAQTGLKGTRVRVSTADNLDAYGYAPDGEVEDFFLQVYAYDYGDLPDEEPAGSPGLTAKENYETIFNREGDRGPRHLIAEGLSIGTEVDAEGNGNPQANGVGDDIRGEDDDEDGVFPPDSIVRGAQATFQVFVTNDRADPAFLQGFVDWNDDGDFEDAYPNQKANLVLIPPGASGLYDVVFSVPQDPNPLPERVAARFRLSDEFEAVTLSTGPRAADDILGEVEDLWVNIVGFDWGDLPEPLYTTDAEGGVEGPSHRLVAVEINPDSSAASLHIGPTPPDVEYTGQPTELADGDNLNNVSDEDWTSACSPIH